MPLFDSTPSFIKTDVHTNRYLLLVEKADFFSPFTRLLGYSLTGLNVDFSNPITVPRILFQNGQSFAQNQVIRGQTARSYTWTLGYPSGNFIMTPTGRLAENLALCERNYHLAYLCPTDDCLSHFWVLPDGVQSPLELGDLIAAPGEDAEAITATSQLYVTQPYLYLYVQGTLSVTQANNALYAVDFSDIICNNCEEPNAVVVWGGEDTGAATPTVYRSTDSLSTINAISPVAPNNVIHGVYSASDTIIVVYADDPDLATATTGGVFISKNAGATWDAGVDGAGAPIADALGDIFLAGGFFYVVGKAGVIWRSIDGVNYEAVTNTITSGTTDFYQGDYDADRDVIYIAGFDPAGPAGVAVSIVNNVLVDISAVVNAGANAIYSVKVLGDDHVAFGLADGNLRESQAATQASAANLYRTILTGATAEVRGIEGDIFRTLVFAGTEIRERSDITDREFAPLDYVAGQAPAGNYQASDTGSDNGFIAPGLNYFIGATDGGELVLARPCYTFAGA